MKKLFLFILVSTSITFSQGKLAFEFENLIGKTFTNNVAIASLKSFKNEQGIVLGNPNEGPFFSTIEVYKKGNQAVVLLSKKIKSNPDEYRIIDVLKLNAIPKNNEVRISDCKRKNGFPEETIIAVVFSGSKRQVKTIKQAYVLKDIRFEKTSIKGIKCFNEGIE
jgi:hypothetical protein